MRDEVPPGIFVQVDTEPLVRAYTDIIVAVQPHPKYFDNAKAKFATETYGWLVAYAQVHICTVVTNEQSARESRREVKVYDRCDPFGG